MEQSPLESNMSSASQKIPHILRNPNPEIYYRIYKRQPPVSLLSQINPIQAPILLFDDTF
jgi:hypothetical protein